MEVDPTPPQPPPRPGSGARRSFRSIFLSDLHLGTPRAKTRAVLDFLAENESEHLYLVGDIIDGWHGGGERDWPESHREVVREIRSRARSGTRVFYVPGNHDEVLRGRVGSERGGIRYVDEHEHVLADGRRFLVVHGDRFDSLLGRRRRRGRSASPRRLAPGGSVPLAWKQRLKRLSGYLGRFERAIVSFARQRRFDGVVCGHVHKPDIRVIDGIVYCNDGDWVQSCTALVEHRDGRLELVGPPPPAAGRIEPERAAG